jgi:SAM-dependent methyltransferase
MTTATDPGFLVLNLGCGPKTSPLCVNIDWSFYLRLRNSRLLRLLAMPLLNARRRAAIDRLDPAIRVHDLSRGIPYPDASVDAVFHSHMLEHLDREVVPAFLAEVRRVLKPGGIHRVCVPDLENNVSLYRRSLERADADPAARADHDMAVARLFEQSVRKRPGGTVGQGRLRYFVERTIVGDARGRGETHQWAYDRVNLAVLLEQAGFAEVRPMRWQESAIPRWPETRLEQDAEGGEYMPQSLYVECRRP